MKRCRELVFSCRQVAEDETKDEEVQGVGVQLQTGCLG
jgi:hypothetical protein